ncbi:MAG TPA: hypothetical protein VK747_17655 [Blastocatellia bacterium]|nr:hypothetical protein [Blastocatellia bacterium]
MARIRMSGKKLVLQGDDFSIGATIILNGIERPTSNDSETPATKLLSKKAGKKIKRGRSVTIQVKNSDGLMSDEFMFTRE